MKSSAINLGYIAPSNVAGRGVFAKKSINKGEIIETAPFLYIPEKEIGSTLNDYVFGYDDDWNILVFGHGSMYNHSKDANVAYEHSELLENSFDYVATKDINAHEELFICYGEKWWDSRQ